MTLLSFTVALAAGFSGYVNFKRQPVDELGQPLPRPLPPAMQTEDESIAARRDMDALAQEVIMNSPADQLTHVSYTHNDGNAGSTSTPMIHVDTLEEPVVLQGTHTLFGARGESTNTYLAIQLYSRTVPADILLSMFQ